MKKILLLIPFILLSMIGYSQKNVYGDMKVHGKLTINSDLDVNGAVNISTIPLGTDIDSVLVMENGQLKSVDGSSFKYDVDTLSNSVYDSLSNHYDLIHALDTGKVNTSGDIMYGDLDVNADVYVDTLHYNALFPAVPSYWSRTPATGMLKPSTATDWINIKDSTYIGVLNNASYPTGAGSRMMWIPVKSAIRAGQVSGTQWNYSNIGIASTAFGWRTKASGNYGSIACGDEVTASGQSSASIGGTLCVASGLRSFIGGGLSNTVSGSYDGAIIGGDNNTSSAVSSIVIGARYGVASGNFSLVSGYYNTSTSDYGVCFGERTTNQSYASFVIGRYNVVSGTVGSWVETDALFVVGNGTGTGANSHNALNLKKNGRLDIRNRTEGLNINEGFIQEYNKKLHDGINDTLYSIVVNSDSAMTSVLNFGYICNNGTERQCRSGVYNIACAIKMGAIVGYQFTSSTAVEHLTSGTLSEGLFLSYNKTTKTIYVIINYDSSLNPTSAQARMNFTINNITGVSTTITNYNYNY
jgi:hypothetical protein